MRLILDLAVIESNQPGGLGINGGNSFPLIDDDNTAGDGTREYICVVRTIWAVIQHQRRISTLTPYPQSKRNKFCGFRTTRLLERRGLTRILRIITNFLGARKFVKIRAIRVKAIFTVASLPQAAYFASAAGRATWLGLFK